LYLPHVDEWNEAVTGSFGALLVFKKKVIINIGIKDWLQKVIAVDSCFGLTKKIS
jgi:hypothetical protein